MVKHFSWKNIRYRVKRGEKDKKSEKSLS